MKNKLLTIAAFALSFGIFPLTLFGSDTTNSGNLPQTFQTFLNADSTNNESLPQSYIRLANEVENNFKQTANMLATIPDPDRKMPDWKAVRELKTKLWLQLLDQIDRTRNLAFDPNDTRNLPFANMTPPGFRYDSGVDPSIIKEPEIRWAYKRDLSENHAIAARLNFERQLKRQDEDYTTFAVQYFDSAYATTPSDAKELIGCLDIISDTKHKAELKEKLSGFTKLFRAVNE